MYMICMEKLKILGENPLEYEQKKYKKRETPLAQHNKYAAH